MSSSYMYLAGNDLPVLYIDQMCYETFPCQHDVRDENGKVRLMFANQIVQLYKDRGLIPDPHFSDQSIVETDYGEDVALDDEEVAALLDVDDENVARCDCCCSDNN
jgi:hypothetical protein